MPGQLECPMSGTNIDADLLYYSRGEDNSSYRPVLTGDRNWRRKPRLLRLG